MDSSFGSTKLGGRLVKDSRFEAESNLCATKSAPDNTKTTEQEAESQDPDETQPRALSEATRKRQLVEDVRNSEEHCQKSHSISLRGGFSSGKGCQKQDRDGEEDEGGGTVDQLMKALCKPS